MINHARALPIAQKRFKSNFSSLMNTVSMTIGGVLDSLSDSEGVIPSSSMDTVLSRCGAVLQSVYVVDGRTSLSSDGAPQSPYAKLLMMNIAQLSLDVVSSHARYMQSHIDPLTQQRMINLSIRESQQKPLTEADIERLRIFSVNPFANYEPAHTWVDPAGYRLSDRIWNTSIRSRQQLDRMMTDLIRQGMGSRDISRQVERFLNPDRTGVRTRIYGGDASYDGMRLARTEITRAHTYAAYTSAQANPYVEKYRMRRSNFGQSSCPVCLQHAGPVGGDGIVYDISEAMLSPYHPHCMCYFTSELTRTPAEITEQLREAMIQAEERLLHPYMTPLQTQSFVSSLLGWDTWPQLLQQIAPIQPRLF